MFRRTEAGGSRSWPARLGAVALWLALWQAAAWAAGSSLLLAGPLETLSALGRLAVTGEFWATVGASAASILGGFGLGFCAGCALGAWAGAVPAVAHLLRPAADALKTVPVACVVVVLLLWVGSAGVTGACVFLVVFPAYYFCMLEAVQARDRRRLAALRLMGVGPVRRALAQGWPGAVSRLAGTSQAAVGMSWKAGVAAELIGLVGATLGERVYQAKLLLETADVFAWTVVVVLCAWVAERAFLALLRASGVWSARLAVALAPRRDGTAAMGAQEPAALVLADAWVARDGAPVLEGLAVRVGPGERLCLRAPSGTGKTTALEALCGLVPLDRGSREAPARVSLVFQDSALVEGLSPRQNLRLVTARDQWQRVEPLLELLPKEAWDRPVTRLSGGQRRRAELARALGAPTGALALDEPFAGLDEKTHRAACRAVLAWQQGRPLLVATHDACDAAWLQADSVDLAPCGARG